MNKNSIKRPKVNSLGRACLFAKREKGDTADTVGDEYDFYANIKGVNYGGAECYMFEILGKRLVRRGDFALM